MSPLHKITVDNKEYFWEYSFEDDYLGYSYLLIKNKDKTGILHIYFISSQCSFNDGVAAMYHDKPIIINLNEPKFVLELIPIALKYININDFRGSYALDNGIELLQILGYHFSY